MPRPDGSSRPAPPENAGKQPHWLAVVLLLIAGLSVAGLISYLGSTALTN